MRLPKRYLIRVVKKRLIEFILMFLVISIVLFGVFMMGGRSDTGILYQWHDDWYIDSNYRNNHNYSQTYVLIQNPQPFPHILIPENNGAEVHYIHSTLVLDGFYFGPEDPYWDSDHIYVFTLDLVPVFKIKQFILYILFICIAISSIVVFTYLYLNRKRFPLTNKLLG